MATNNAIDIGVVPGGGFTYTFPSASGTLVAKDTNSNLSANNFLEGYTTTATAAGTTTLTVASTEQQFFTGSTTQTIVLPVASTLVLGQSFLIFNNSIGALTVNSSGGNLVQTIAGNSAAYAIVTCILTSGTSGASWSSSYYSVSIAQGKNLGVANTITLVGTDGTSMTFPSSSTNVVGNTTTQTLTNKRVTRRVVTTTQAAAPAINTDNTDMATITGLAQAITSFTTNLTGTPTMGDFLEIQITDNGTARALTFGASFAASTVALPTTTVISTLLHVLFEWDSGSSKWICVAVA